MDSGEYEFRLIVYDLATLKPTVKPAVCEVETVLAILQFSEGKGWEVPPLRGEFWIIHCVGHRGREDPNYANV